MSFLVWVSLLVLLETQGAAPPGQGGQSTPDVVRRDYDMRQLATPPPFTESELSGRRLFTQRCGICHDPVGQGRTAGPWVDRETLNTSGEASVRNIILGGSPRMPAFKYALQPNQVDHIIAFLKTVRPDQRPKTATP